MERKMVIVVVSVVDSGSELPQASLYRCDEVTAALGGKWGTVGGKDVVCRLQLLLRLWLLLFPSCLLLPLLVTHSIGLWVCFGKICRAAFCRCWEEHKAEASFACF